GRAGLARPGPPPALARDRAARMPGAQLLEGPGAGHGLLDSRSQIAQIAIRWSASGPAHELPRFAAQLAELPATPTGQPLRNGLLVALAAERYSPWRLWVEGAKQKREQAQVGP